MPDVMASLPCSRMDGFTCARQRHAAQEKPAVASSIAQNGELMGKFGLRGTPGLVWKDKQGKIQMKGGMPRLSEIPSITGLPEQKNDDPMLARFR